MTFNIDTAGIDHIILIKMSKPKVVKISLEPNKFKLPLSKLKKTFDEGTDVLQEISKHSEAKRREMSKMKEQPSPESSESEELPPITKEQLETCTKIYGQLDPKQKGHFTAEDIPKLRSQKARQAVEVVCWRKRENSMFDLVYGLWDSGSMSSIEGSD